MISKKRSVIFGITAIFLFLFILEGSSRIVQYSRGRNIKDSIFAPIYRHYYFLGPAFKPNSGGSWQALSDVKINSLGFRGPEFAIKKSKNVLRILTFGGSTTHSGNYPEKLERLLKKNPKFREEKVEVINASVPTWGSTQNLIRFLIQGVYLEPDFIIYYEAINDADKTDYYWFYHLPEVQYEKYGGFLRNHFQFFNFVRNRIVDLKNILAMWWWKKNLINISPSSLNSAFDSSTQLFRTDIENLIVLAKHSNSRVILVTMPLNYDPSNNRLLAAEKAGYGYQDFERLVKKVNRLNEVLRQLATRHKVYLTDAAKSNMAQYPENFVDLCHFTEKGASVFAELVANTLASI